MVKITRIKEWYGNLTKKKRIMLWVVVAIIIILAIPTENNDEVEGKDSKNVTKVVDKQEINESDKQEKSDEPEEEEEPKTPEEIVTKIIVDTLGEETNIGEKRIQDLSVTAGEGEKIVSVTINADDNLTTEFIRDGILFDSSELFPLIFEDNEVIDVTLMWQLPLQDQYGNIENEVVLRVGLTRETYEKINFDNFLIENYANVADQYFVHPAMNE